MPLCCIRRSLMHPRLMRHCAWIVALGFLDIWKSKPLCTQMPNTWSLPKAMGLKVVVLESVQWDWRSIYYLCFQKQFSLVVLLYFFQSFHWGRTDIRWLCNYDIFYLALKFTSFIIFLIFGIWHLTIVPLTKARRFVYRSGVSSFQRT